MMGGFHPTETANVSDDLMVPRGIQFISKNPSSRRQDELTH